MATSLYIMSEYELNSTTPTAKGTWRSGSSTRRYMPPTKLQDEGWFNFSQAENSATNPTTRRMFIGVSPPLAGTGTFAGTLDVLMGACSSDAAADFYWKIFVWLSDGDTNVSKGTLLDWEENTTNEWPVGSATSATVLGLQAAQNLAGLTWAEGDRIIFEFGFISRNSSTTLYTGRIFYGTSSYTYPYPLLTDATLGATFSSTGGSGKAGMVVLSDTLTFLIDPEYPNAPANDDCGNAIDITGQLPYSAPPVDAQGAFIGSDPLGSCSSGDGAGIWYKITPPITTSFRFDVDNYDASDAWPVLSVWTGSCGSMSQVFCDDNGPGSVFSPLAVTGGVEYHIQLASSGWSRGSAASTFRVQSTEDYFPIEAGIASGANSGAVVNLTATLPRDGDGTFNYQWYRSTSSGFSPSVGTLLAGGTTRIYTDATVVRGVTYYYILRITDGDSNFDDTNEITFAIPGALPDSKIVFQEEFLVAGSYFQTIEDTYGPAFAGVSYRRGVRKNSSDTDPDDAVDPDYPKLSSVSKMKVYVGAGPDGQNTLDWYTPAQNVGIYETDGHPLNWSATGRLSYLGLGSTAVGSRTDATPAHYGELSGIQYFKKTYLDFAGLNAMTIAGLTLHNLSPTNNNFTTERLGGGNLLGPAAIQLSTNQSGSYDAGTDTTPTVFYVHYRVKSGLSSFTTTVQNVKSYATTDAVATIVNKHVRWRLEWRCGTPDLSSWRVAADGWFDVYINDVLVYSKTGIRLCLNDIGDVDKLNVVPDAIFGWGGSGNPGAISSLLLRAAHHDYTPPVVDTDEFEPEFGTTFGPLIWIEFYNPATEAVIAHAKVDLNDSITYYKGQKFGKILSMDRVVRALSSDDDGVPEGQRWGATYDDNDRYFRNILGRSDFRRLILNGNVKMRMISNRGRLALEIPRTVALGLIRNYRLD